MIYIWAELLPSLEKSLCETIQRKCQDIYMYITAVLVFNLSAQNYSYHTYSAVLSFKWTMVFNVHMHRGCELVAPLLLISIQGQVIFCSCERNIHIIHKIVLDNKNKTSW